MIKKQSDDPDVVHAATQAYELINTTLNNLPKATTFDYGGHVLNIGDYDVCTYCTTAIAEAQQARVAIDKLSFDTEDLNLKEHFDIVSELFKTEAASATIRAQLHNGHNTENILNTVLRFNYDRNINDSYKHSHHQGK